jgi:hypothetical protein
MVISAGEQSGPGGGANGSRVKVGKPQPIVRQLLNVGCLHQTSKSRSSAEACVVNQNPNHIGRAGRGFFVVVNFLRSRFGKGVPDLPPPRLLRTVLGKGRKNTKKEQYKNVARFHLLDGLRIKACPERFGEGYNTAIFPAGQRRCCKGKKDSFFKNQYPGF